MFEISGYYPLDTIQWLQFNGNRHKGEINWKFAIFSSSGNAVGSITGQYDWALASKKFLAYEYFIGNARSIGSSSQNDFMDDVIQFKALGKLSRVRANSRKSFKMSKRLLRKLLFVVFRRENCFFDCKHSRLISSVRW